MILTWFLQKTCTNRHKSRCKTKFQQMLVSFSVSNFLSFKDEVTFSMVASNDTANQKNVYRNAQGSGLDLLKSAVIYGANASGKTNFIEAFLFFTHFINSSFSNDKPIYVPKFKLDDTYQTKPSTFEVAFLENGERFIYGYMLQEEIVIEEWLYHIPGSHKRTMFERKLIRTSSFPQIKFGNYWEGVGKSLVGNTRNNTLFLTLASLNNNKIAKRVTGWIENFKSASMNPYSGTEYQFTNSLVSESPKIKSDILDLIKSADLGIIDLIVEEDEFRQPANWQELPEYLQRALKDEFENHKLEASFIHKGSNVNGSEKRVQLDINDESHGTRKFYSLIGPLISVIVNGCLLFSDELDVQLHSVLTKGIINFFHKTIDSDDRCQLVFTTHDSYLLEDELFRRDQIWFTEKEDNGATNMYSLWDFKENKPRKHEKIRKRYLEGRYGAIPVLGEMFE